MQKYGRFGETPILRTRRLPEMNASSPGRVSWEATPSGRAGGGVAPAAVDVAERATAWRAISYRTGRLASSGPRLIEGFILAASTFVIVPSALLTPVQGRVCLVEGTVTLDDVPYLNRCTNRALSEKGKRI